MLKISLKVENTEGKAGTAAMFNCNTPKDAEGAQDAISAILYMAVQQMGYAADLAEVIAAGGGLKKHGLEEKQG